MRHRYTLTLDDTIWPLQQFQLTRSLTLIGRDSDCDICLIDSWVSFRHCEIVLREDGVFASDLESTNGTFVNGNRIVWCQLNPGDCLTLGITNLRFDRLLALEVTDGSAVNRTSWPSNQQAFAEQETVSMFVLDALWNDRSLTAFSLPTQR